MPRSKNTKTSQKRGPCGYLLLALKYIIAEQSCIDCTHRVYYITAYLLMQSKIIAINLINCDEHCTNLRKDSPCAEGLSLRRFISQ